MSRCWEEGEWRAYLDGELPAEEMAQAREHLAECAACGELHREVSARALRVSALMMSLEVAPSVERKPAHVRPAWHWAAAGIALAAGLAAAFVLSPKRMETVRAPALAQVAPAPLRPLETPRARPEPVAMNPMRRARSARRGQSREQYFLGLDDQPIDTGVVMRVALENGIEADVIVDAEGRPRAIRAVR